MASSFIVWYLFLGGAGASAFFVAGVFDLAARFSSEKVDRIARIVEVGLFAGPILVIISAVFLVFDLGVPSRAINVFFNDELTLLGFGSWSLVIFVFSSFASIILGLFFEGRAASAAELVFHVTAVVSAMAIMVYSGIFLSVSNTVPFLNESIVPVLFVLSAFSSGIAVILLLAVLRNAYLWHWPEVRVVLSIDALVIVIELVILAIFIGLTLAKGDLVSDSLESMLLGENSLVFWFGAVIAGMIMPLAAEIVCSRSQEKYIIAIGACGSLVGGFCLRYSLLASATRVSLVSMMSLPYWM